MAHKTLIAGVAYEVSGGKALIGGTAYNVKNGKTLVDGTVYNVKFDDGIRTITVDGCNHYLAYVSIKGNICNSGIITVSAGTVIECYVNSWSTKYPGEVLVNGNKVYTSEYGTYEYTVTSDAYVFCYSERDPYGEEYGTVEILEIPKDYVVVVIQNGASDGYSPATNVIIDGRSFSATQLVAVPKGAVISFEVTDSGSSAGKGHIILNNETVATTGTSGKATYDLVANGNLKVSINTPWNISGQYGIINITEQ